MTDLQALSIMHDLERWSDIRKLLERPGKITGADFEPDPAILEFLQSDARVLVVGAGGSPGNCLPIHCITQHISGLLLFEADIPMLMM